jgi:hypothetical protein
MAISPSCTRVWTVNLCRGDRESTRFWGLREEIGPEEEWTAGLMALRGGHQSLSGRPVGRIPWWSAERTQSQTKVRPVTAAGGRPIGVKIVMECRQPVPRRGAAKQKRKGAVCPALRAKKACAINVFYEELFMARGDLRSKRNGPVDHFERRFSRFARRGASFSRFAYAHQEKTKPTRRT